MEAIQLRITGAPRNRILPNITSADSTIAASAQNRPWSPPAVDLHEVGELAGDLGGPTSGKDVSSWRNMLIEAMVMLRSDMMRHKTTESNSRAHPEQSMHVSNTHTPVMCLCPNQQVLVMYSSKNSFFGVRNKYEINNRSDMSACSASIRRSGNRDPERMRRSRATVALAAISCPERSDILCTPLNWTLGQCKCMNVPLGCGTLKATGVL